MAWKGCYLLTLQTISWITMTLHKIRARLNHIPSKAAYDAPEGEDKSQCAILMWGLTTEKTAACHIEPEWSQAVLLQGLDQSRTLQIDDPVGQDRLWNRVLTRDHSGSLRITTIRCGLTTRDIGQEVRLIKLSFYQYRNCHDKDKTILSLYWETLYY